MSSPSIYARLFASLSGAVLSLTLVSGSAAAGTTKASAPASGGLDAVEVAIDARVGALTVRRCKAAGCADAIVRSIPIALDRARLDLARASVDVLPIGEGRHVVHARIPDVQRSDLAFEAVVAGNDGEPIFAGLTGYTRGEDGDRSGEVVLVYDRDGASKFVLLAEMREDTRICGQTVTPLGARGIDPRTMKLRGATLHRLDKQAREGAARLVATARARAASPPLARVLAATGGSSPGATALTDGSLDTAWSEARPGDGHGEFVTMRAPAEVPIHAFDVTITPSAPKRSHAAPRTFYVATDARVFHVTVPEDAAPKPGARYTVPLPEPVRTSCVALVLDEAYARDLASPEVSLAEIGAITRFDADGASIDDVAKELGGARSDEALAVLRRSGDAGLDAVARRWPSLDQGARALAVDVAASAGTCDGAAMDLLTQALADQAAEVKRRAIGRIERCGKAATDALVRAVRSEDETRRAAAAPVLATIARSAALDPLGAALGKGSPETRRAVRGALARAAASAPRERLFALLASADASESADAPAPRLDLLRALGPRLPELRPQSSAAVADLLRSSPDMATRWLLVQPLAHLARASDATAGERARLAEGITRDADWPVRARAVELGADIAALAPDIVAATADPEPRVREAALHAVATAKIAAGADAAARALSNEPWTFVRVAAVEAIGAIGTSDPAQAALVRALRDASPKVRAAAVTALGRRQAHEHASKIRDRLDDTAEDTDVRALAARTLGAMCVQGATDRLTKLALLARAPVDEADERIGTAAISALAALHPPDLEQRLAPLRAKEVRMPLRRAAERALTEPGACR